MSKILIKDNEPYFIDSIYDLYQVVDDDTYDFILELLEDEKEEQCERCNYCDPNDIYDYKDDYDECVNVLYEASDLFKDVSKLDNIDDVIKENIRKMLKDIKWALR